MSLLSFLFHSGKKYSFIAILILLVTLPLVLFSVQQRQNVQEHASGNNKTVIPLKINPPHVPACEIRNADGTKNYVKCLADQFNVKVDGTNKATKAQAVASAGLFYSYLKIPLSYPHYLQMFKAAGLTIMISPKQIGEGTVAGAWAYTASNGKTFTIFQAFWTGATGKTKTSGSYQKYVLIHESGHVVANASQTIGNQTRTSGYRLENQLYNNVHDANLDTSCFKKDFLSTFPQGIVDAVNAATKRRQIHETFAESVADSLLCNTSGTCSSNGSGGTSIPNFPQTCVNTYNFIMGSVMEFPSKTCTGSACISPANASPTLPISQPPPASILPKGNFDNASCTVFQGWACDGDNYNQPITVNFYDGINLNSFIGATTADVTREAAVGAQCGGSPAHGFSFATPTNLKNGTTHQIYAYGININSGNSNPVLGNSPKAITCAGPTQPPTSPTEIPIPTHAVGSPTPTPSVEPDQTRLSFTIGLDAIGKTGDSTNSISNSSNKTPNTASRTLSAQIFNNNNQLIATLSFPAIYNPTTGLFEGSANAVSANIETGSYIIKVATPGRLMKVIPGTIRLISGQNNKVPLVNLIAGDINGDNKLDIVDFNILISCSVFAKTSDAQKACKNNTVYKTSSDLNDDGVINQIDYSYFLREFFVQKGD